MTFRTENAESKAGGLSIAAELTDGPAQDQSDVDVRLPWYHRRKSVRFQITAWLSRYTNGRVKSPGYYSLAVLQRKNDIKDLEKYRISPNEHVQSWCLWTAEFYTPDNIEQLQASLDRLKSAGFEYDEHRPSGWLRANRGRAGNSMELYLVPKGKATLGIGHYCPLPRFAKGAQGTIANVTSSLTMLTMHFLLEDVERDWLDQELHLDHPGRITQESQGVLSTSGVSEEQRRLVEEKRLSWINQVTEWHHENFPGLLSSSGERVSCCLLDIVDGADPLGSARSSLLEALDLARSIDVSEYKSPEGQNLIHLIRGGGRGILGHVHLMVIKKDCLPAFEASGYGNNDDGGVAHLDALFRRTFSWIALPRILEFFERRAAVTRDGAAAIIGSSNASKALARVRNDTAKSMDAALIARELRDGAQSGWIPQCEMDFALRPWRDDKPPLSLAHVLRDQITYRSKNLLADVEALNNSLTVQANLLSAHANLKLQPLIIGLAAISMFAGLIAAASTVRDLLSSKAEHNQQVVSPLAPIIRARLSQGCGHTHPNSQLNATIPSHKNAPQEREN